jgi:hypothetical protein
MGINDPLENELVYERELYSTAAVEKKRDERATAR